jgi:hypothetical protein
VRGIGLFIRQAGDMRYIKYAMSKTSELKKMLTNEGLSCTKAENSPSAYIIESKILRCVNDKITNKDFVVDKRLLRFVDIVWFQERLNRISSVERLTKLHEILTSQGLEKLILELKQRA